VSIPKLGRPFVIREIARCRTFSEPHAEQNEIDVMRLSGSVVPSWSALQDRYLASTNLGSYADVRPTLSF
jgi:hypothetical protein